MLQKPLDFWQPIIWSEESKFELFSSKDRVMVRRTPKETFDPQCIIPTVKHLGDIVHAEESESCMFLIEQATGFIPTRYESGTYYLLLRSFAFSGGFTFMHGNDPRHTLPLVKDWLVK